MSALVPANFGAVSNRFQQTPAADDLSSGIASSFGIVGYKGKVWSIRYRGDETPLMREDGDGPRGSVEVVVLKASTHISKIWYENGYVEGSSAAPDCFSNNGIAPEPTSTKPQCTACAICPMNAWGSRTSAAGKAGKACSDSKRLAVAPLADLENEVYGGPMLLRVPAASLQDLASFGQKMQGMGYPYYSIGMKIAFDAAESYPKFVFSGLRPLTDPEADIVLQLRDGHLVNRILSENEFAPAPAAAAASSEPLFEQAPGVGAAGTPAAAAKTPEPVKSVTPVVTEEDDEEAALMKQMAALKAAKAAKAAALAGDTVDPEQAERERYAALAIEQSRKKAEEEAAANAARVAEEAKAIKAAKAAEAKALKAQQAAEAKAIEEARAAKVEEPAEDDEEAALMAALAAARAKKEKAALAAKLAGGDDDEPEAPAPVAATTAAATTTAVADTQNMASSFESDLDNMLANLLP